MMNYNLHTASDINLLTGKLAENLKASENIFIPSYVITTNYGLNNWIKLQLAEHNGIAANLRFVKNEEFTDIIVKVTDAKAGANEKITSVKLIWLIFLELSKEDFINNFKSVSDYYKEDEVKKYALASKLVGLFEKYQKLIPDFGANENDFQHYIWSKIRGNSVNNFIADYDIPKYLEKEFKSEEKQNLLREKLPDIHIFLPQEFSKTDLDIYDCIAKYVKVHIYIFRPFGTSCSPNLLVRNWGGILRNMPFDFGNETGFEADNSSEDKGVDSLLQQIQKGIKLNVDIDFDFTQKDRSLVINNCYTPVREVEVLYNYLLRTIIKSGGKIGAKDILVQVSDMDVYSPAVQGIFSSAPKKLPYNISDNSYSATDSVFNAIDALMNFDNRFKAESVIQLLEFKSVREKFEIQDIDNIRMMVDRANIRFGTYGEEEIETNSVSWIHGLNRLIYGFCIGGEEYFELSNDNDSDSGWLVDIVEGAAASDLINLHFFFGKLMEWVALTNGSKPLEDWKNYTDDLINDFIAEDKQEDIKGIQHRLTELTETKGLKDTLIEFRVFREFVCELLAGENNQKSFSSGGITFCSMSQMRNLPYKVIAVLGANLNVFPRHDKVLSYDLLKDDNDIPSLKDRDKYFFLQTLMSAEEKLYISYIGKNARNNSMIPPSALVDELINYISNHSANEKYLITEHPLHGFDSKYNTDTEKYSELYSYLIKSEESEQEVNNSSSTPSGIEEINKEISIADFISFFKNPFKYFYNKRLGIYYSDNAELLSETELFDMDGLQKWIIKDNLLNSENNESFRQEMVEEGKIPLMNTGQILLNECSEDISNLKQKYEELKGGNEEEKIYTEVYVGDYLLRGNIPGVFADKYIYCCVSKEGSHIKNLIAYKINRLLLGIEFKNLNCNFISVDGKNEIEESLLHPEESQRKLKLLFQYFIKGREKVLPFLGVLKKNEIETINKRDDIYQYLKSQVESDYISIDDPYFTKEFHHLFTKENNMSETFKKNINHILSDILDIQL
jgi:exodeoxyribonuclease V gamma subunit